LPFIATNTRSPCDGAAYDPPRFVAAERSLLGRDRRHRPNVVPALLGRHDRTWYSALGTIPYSDSKRWGIEEIRSPALRAAMGVVGALGPNFESARIP